MQNFNVLPSMFPIEPESTRGVLGPKSGVLETHGLRSWTPGWAQKWQDYVEPVNTHAPPDQQETG